MSLISRIAVDADVGPALDSIVSIRTFFLVISSSGEAGSWLLSIVVDTAGFRTLSVLQVVSHINQKANSREGYLMAIRFWEALDFSFVESADLSAPFFVSATNEL